MKTLGTLTFWLKRMGRKLSWLLAAKVLAGFFVFYLLLSYFAVDPIARKLVPSIAEKSLNSVASVKRVEFDPFRLKATVHDLHLTSKSGGALAGFKKLVIDFELSGMFDLAWKFRQIGIVEPTINLAISPEGQLNWDALLDKLKEGPEQPPSDTIPSIIVEQFIVDQGNVHYVDANRPTPIDTTLAPLSFQLNGFSTLPRDRGEYLISAVFSEDGGMLKWKGDMGVNPVASTGVVSLEGVNIAEAIALVKGLKLPIKVSKGEAQTSFAYDFSLPKTVPTVTLSNVSFGLNDVAGELVDGGNVSLTHVGLITPRLTFVKNKQPILQIENLDFKLMDLQLSQGNGNQVMLKESKATLPLIDVQMTEQTQLLFQDLNVKLTALTFNQDQQFALAIPATVINAVNLNLAENNVSVKDMVLSNIQLGNGKVNIKGEDTQAIAPLATLASIKLTDGQVALVDKKLSMQSVSFSGLNTSVIKHSDGSLNWVEMFANNQHTSTTETPVKAQETAALDDEQTKQDADTSTDKKVVEASWTVDVATIALNEANIHIEDNSLSAPVVLDVLKASVEVNDATLDMTKSIALKAAFRVKQGGKFSAKGKLWPALFKADLGLQLSQLSMKPFAPYLNQMAKLKLNNGVAGLSGKLNLQQKHDFSLAFKGKFDVKKLAIIEELDDKPFLSWNRLGSKDLTVSLMPNKLHMGSLTIDQPSGKFIIFEDKSMNINRIMRGASQEAVAPPVENSQEVVVKAAEPVESNASLIQAQVPQVSSKVAEKEVNVKSKTESAAASTDTFPVSINAVRINDAKLEFADLSLTPQFGTNIHSLTGVINGLSTKVDKVAQVEMDGKVDEYGSARIRGSLQPFKATDFTDIKLAFTNVDMSRLTPYSGKFAGRHIDSGKLSVDLGYKIKQQQLVGENKLVINKLKLGEKVDSEDAADLPLDLAIAILEDSDGVIDLDLPITGSLDDPEFSYGSIVWKAFTNILTKIVTAPFRALGKLFGGDGEAFDGIAFEAGLSVVAPPELEKLAKVSEALAKRQGLSLGIVPSFSSQDDTQAIQEAIYRRQVFDEMGVVLEEGQRPGPIDLSNEEVQAAIQTLHNKLTKKGFFKRMAGKFEKPEAGFYEKAQSSLIDSVEVTKADLEALAEVRAKAIEAALLSNGVSPDRLSIVKVVDVKAKDKIVKTELTLDVKQSPSEVSSALPNPTDKPIADAEKSELPEPSKGVATPG